MRNCVAFIMLIASVLLSAQTPNVVKKDNAAQISIIPSEYTVSGKPIVITSDYDKESRSYELQQYDTKLEKEQSMSFTPPSVKTIKTRIEEGAAFNLDCKLCILSDTTMTRQAIDIPSSSVKPVKKISGITVDEVKEFFIPTLPDVILDYYQYLILQSSKVLEYKSFSFWGGTVFAAEEIMPYDSQDENNDMLSYRLLFDNFGSNPDSPYRGEERVSKTIENIFLLNSKGEFYKVGFNRIDELKPRISRYNSVLEVTYEEFRYYVTQPQPIKMINHGLTKDYTLMFSQTLFNNDDDIEYIGYRYNPVTVVEDRDRDGDGYCDFRRTQFKKCSVVGLIVANATGGDQYCYDFPDGYQLVDKSDIDLLDLQDERYLIAHVENERGDKYMLVYRIDKTQSSIEQISVPVRALITPTLVNRGAGINVLLPDDHGATDIIVTSATGRTELALSVSSGDRSITIPTYDLSQGLHIVTVVDRENNDMESTKVIVK